MLHTLKGKKGGGMDEAGVCMCVFQCALCRIHSFVQCASYLAAAVSFSVFLSVSVQQLQCLSFFLSV